MAGLLAPPGHQFTDDNGQPLAFGKVYTKVAGTSTDKATYTTQSEAVEHPNPVILDAYGRADIWLATDGLYKITITDANDAQIGDPVDNVSATGGSFSSGITLAGNLDVNGNTITSNNNGNITINPAGTGKTNIYDPVCKDDLDLDGNDIIATDGSTVKETSTGYEILEFNAASNAVNYTAVNATATGVAPGLEAKGDDTNIGQAFQVKGNEAYHFKGTADTAAETRLYEDTDNGTNYVGLKAPASVSSSVTFTLPSADGTNGQTLVTDASGTLSFTNLPAGVELLATYTPSGAASVDITSVLSSSYKVYDIHVIGLTPATDNVYIDLLVSTNNGGSFETSSYSAAQVDSYNNTTSSNSSTSSLRLHSQALSNTAPHTFKITVQDPTNSSYPTTFHSQGQTLRQAQDYLCIAQAGGRWSTTTAVNALQLKASSGNISGLVLVYGYSA